MHISYENFYKPGRDVRCAIDIMRMSHHVTRCQILLPYQITAVCLVRLHDGFGLGDCVSCAMTREDSIKFGRNSRIPSMKRRLIRYPPDAALII